MSLTDKMTPVVDVVVRRLSPAAEIYITSRPCGDDDLSEQASAMFSDIAQTLRSHDAKIITERVIGAPEAMTDLVALRRDAYGDLDDGVAPAWLTDQAGPDNPLAGIHVHAIAGPSAVQPLTVDTTALGRSIRIDGRTLIAATGLLPDSAAGDPADQALEMLLKAERLLAVAGADFSHVARTWMWLRDVLDWYGDFNRVRNEFFVERGLLSKDSSGRLPASTGIGMAPAGDRMCSMDLCGLTGTGSEIEYLLAAGNQGSASSYGSAFSRATAVATPAGRTVFVSGTASIDADGNTTHLDDAPRQIQDTIDNVVAVLRDGGCCEADIVQSIIYCKTPQVAKIFREGWGDLSWPHVVTTADVCRDDLLFEIEATAMTAR